MEVCLSSKRSVFARKSEGSFVLCRAYLVALEQAFDIIRFKNYKIEMQRLQDSNLPIQRKTMAELQTRYQVTQKPAGDKLQFELT